MYNFSTQLFLVHGMMNYDIKAVKSYEVSINFLLDVLFSLQSCISSWILLSSPFRRNSVIYIPYKFLFIVS